MKEAAAPTLRIVYEPSHEIVAISGELLTARLAVIEDAFLQAAPTRNYVEISVENLSAIDTGGAWLVSQLRARLEASGTSIRITGAQDHLALIETVTNATPEEIPHEVPQHGRWEWVADIGRKLVSGWGDALSLVSFLGQTLAGLADVIVRPHKVRWPSLFTHMQDVGLNAVPIVALMGFLIGVVLGFQGASQLQQFGAEVFVVELIGISVLRELGILLTAIIVAGRSGSAFTASVGSMKVQQEIDAMQTLGLDPVRVLVVPRVLALLIMLPLLGFVANLFGLFGGALMSWVSLDVNPGMFLTRLHDNIAVKHLLVGMVKAPFFALVIGVVACWQAFQVKGSSTSVGQRTTSSVVQGIFLVIALDALFSIFFAQLGV